MQPAKHGDTVAIHYTGTLDDGSVFDSSQGREPLEFSIGANQVIPGFEAAVLGLEIGQSCKTRIEPENAYGQRRDEMILTVPKDRFPEGVSIEPGMQFEANNGQTVVVTGITDAGITLDGNHPLAGKALTFDINLVSIR